MLVCDALIVGGGPGGSTCARALRLAGWDVLVLDRARFPRDKVCGGWVTPEVFPLLDLDPAGYRASGRTIQDITGFRTGLIGGRAIETRYPSVVSYTIRRCEFDDYLLRRSGARVLDGTPFVSMERDGSEWIVNGEIRARAIVGAGGHFCPVARHLQGTPDRRQPVVARELEFELDGGRSSVAGEVPELFFSRDLEGYGWCVRKGDFLNVGIGRRDRDGFSAHVRDFLAFLVGSGRAPESAARAWRGHAYHAFGTGVRPLVADGVLIVGDAAGLAYPESGEGIKPAVESGLLAARTLIAAGDRVSAADLAPYERTIRARHAPVSATPPWLQPAVKALGRTLLSHSPLFTRRVVIDRWFLRRQGVGPHLLVDQPMEPSHPVRQ
jgi:geranylgeranyl reductase family protein